MATRKFTVKGEYTKDEKGRSNKNCIDILEKCEQINGKKAKREREHKKHKKEQKCKWGS